MDCAGAAKGGDYFYRLQLLLMAERPTLIAIRTGEYIASMVSGAGALFQSRGLRGDVTTIVVYGEARDPTVGCRVTPLGCGWGRIILMAMNIRHLYYQPIPV